MENDALEVESSLSPKWKWGDPSRAFVSSGAGTGVGVRDGAPELGWFSRIAALPPERDSRGSVRGRWQCSRHFHDHIEDTRKTRRGTSDFDIHASSAILLGGIFVNGHSSSRTDFGWLSSPLLYNRFFHRNPEMMLFLYQCGILYQNSTFLGDR